MAERVALPSVFAPRSSTRIGQPDSSGSSIRTGSAQSPAAPVEFSGVDFSDGELRLKGPGLKDDTVQTLKTALEPQGYTLRLEGGTLSVSPAAAPAAGNGVKP